MAWLKRRPFCQGCPYRGVPLNIQARVHKVPPYQNFLGRGVEPKSGSQLIFFFIFSPQTKRYRIDGYEWKTRKTTNAVREDRMKLKVGGYQVSCQPSKLYIATINHTGKPALRLVTTSVCSNVIETLSISVFHLLHTNTPDWWLIFP